MTKNILALLCLLSGFSLYSQDLKTGVLVVGSTPSAMSAAIQSAKSGVKTLLIDVSKFDNITLSPADRAIKAGFYLEFAKRVDSLQKSPLKDQQTLSPGFTATVFKTFTDTLKNLTILPNALIKKIERSGKGWEIDLVKREIKADVIVDATADQSVTKIILSKNSNPSPSAEKLSDKSYRTSVAVTTGKVSSDFLNIPLSTLLVPGVENLVRPSGVGQMSLITGQAAGATAAYCTFFKTTTKNLNVRLIQTELLSYNSQLIRFNDILDTDSSMLAIQHIGLTGILRAKEENGKFNFMPDSPVSTDELKQPLREYYSRSQIWFLDNKEEKLTLATALSLIKFLASRGEELNREVQKSWKDTLRLKSNFDLKRVITRKELVILLDTYLKPYTVAVDMEGNVKR